MEVIKKVKDTDACLGQNECLPFQLRKMAIFKIAECDIVLGKIHIHVWVHLFLP